jgi:hypothetical protein
MKRLATFTLFVCLFAPAIFALEGAWTASLEESDRNRANINITTGHHNNMGLTMTVASFWNLTPSQLDAATMTPVTFELRREAGTISFEGTFKHGKGAGQFTFAPDRSYIDKIRSLGLSFDLERHHRRKDRTEDDDLFTLALHDVSTAYIKSMQAIGYNTTLEKYLTMRIFDVTPAYVKEMESLGFGKLTDDQLVATKIHRVTPQYVREMRAAGWSLTLDEFEASRIHGATPEFAAEMKQLGYGNLTFDDLLAFRIHHVTAELITTLRKLGYDNVSGDDLVAMRIHGVTPEFIQEVRAAGYDHVPVEKLVEMRIHHIDARMMKAMNGQ